jgi:general secretion pathway protein C
MSKLLWAVKASLVAMLLYVALEAIVTPFQLDAGLKPKAVSGNERASVEPQVKPEVQTRPDYSVIAKNDMFAGPSGSDDLRAAPAPSAVLPSAEELGLKLVGTVAGSPNFSRAIIHSAETGVASTYKIGDRVASATIEAIESDQVVLLHAGRRLALQKHITASTAAPGSTGEPQTQVMPSARQATNSQQTQPASARLGYVEELFRQATIEPHVEDGQTKGLKITGLEQTPLANLFGLRNGDIVQTVNGQNLNSKQKAFQVLKKARTQSNISLQLLRDGKAKELSFDL